MKSPGANRGISIDQVILCFDCGGLGIEDQAGQDRDSEHGRDADQSGGRCRKNRIAQERCGVIRYRGDK